MGADPSSAFGALIQNGGILGAACVLLVIGICWLAVWLRAANNDRIADIKSSLEARYKDNEEQREILRDLKSAIEANTNAMNATVRLLQGRSSA